MIFPFFTYWQSQQQQQQQSDGFSNLVQRDVGLSKLSRRVWSRMTSEIEALMRQPPKNRFVNDHIQVFTLPDDYPVVSLRGQRSVRVTRSLPAHKVIFVYEGL
jgi:hypothetical protein